MLPKLRFSLKFLIVLISFVCIGIYAYVNSINISNYLYFQNVCVVRTSIDKKIPKRITLLINNNSKEITALVFNDSQNTNIEFLIEPSHEGIIQCAIDIKGNFQINWNGKLVLNKKFSGGGYGVTPSNVPIVITSGISQKVFSGTIHHNGMWDYDFSISSK